MATDERSMIDRLGGHEGIQRLAGELAGILRADEVLAPLVTGEAYDRLRSQIELTLIGSSVDRDIVNAITGVLNGIGGGVTGESRHGEMVVAFDSLLNGNFIPLGRLVKSLNDSDLIDLTAAGNMIASGGELVLSMRARMRGIL